MTSTEILRKQAIEYIKKADENSLRRVNAILEIDQNSNEWWKDKEFVDELDRMDAALESGEEKGLTIDDIETSIETRRKELYGA